MRRGPRDHRRPLRGRGLAELRGGEEELPPDALRDGRVGGLPLRSDSRPGDPVPALVDRRSPLPREAERAGRRSGRQASSENLRAPRTGRCHCDARAGQPRGEVPGVRSGWRQVRQVEEPPRHRRRRRTALFAHNPGQHGRPRALRPHLPGQRPDAHRRAGHFPQGLPRPGDGRDGERSGAERSVQVHAGPRRLHGRRHSQAQHREPGLGLREGLHCRGDREGEHRRPQQVLPLLDEGGELPLRRAGERPADRIDAIPKVS